MDATAWSITYLSRQDARNQSWFRHLDFIKVTGEGIKKILWVPSMEKMHSEYVPPPLTLRRDPQAIRSFYKLGLTQKRKLIKKYARFEEDPYYELLNQPGADTSMPSSSSFPCSGLTIEGIMSSKQISDGRKETLSYGYKHVVREGMIAKAKLLHPDNFAWSDESFGTAKGVITTGIKRTHCEYLEPVISKSKLNK